MHAPIVNPMAASITPCPKPQALLMGGGGTGCSPKPQKPYSWGVGVLGAALNLKSYSWGVGVLGAALNPSPLLCIRVVLLLVELLYLAPGCSAKSELGVGAVQVDVPTRSPLLVDTRRSL